MGHDPECVWALGATLGEGPVWDAAEDRLWFTDIKGRRLHCFNPASGTGDSFSVPHEAGFVALAEGGGLVVGMNHGLHLFEDGQVTRKLAGMAAPAGTRINDGTVDCHGRIWFGTMDDGEREKTGAVHCHDGDSVIRTVGGDAVITNGPAVSADGRHVFHVDTVERTIWRFDAADDKVLRAGAVFARIEDGAGYPDGVTLDVEGCLWVCLWGGGRVRRYAPDGALLEEVGLPVSQVTKLAFGGEGMRTAFVTTAAKGLKPAERAAQPLAGGLFAFDAGVAGFAAFRARVPSGRG